MENKKLTLIIPGHNVERFIEKALNNVFCQSSTAFDVIYVDDASTDSSLKIIKTQFAQLIDAKRLRLLELKVNGGPATARQRALDLVATPYVTFMDADDKYTSSDVFQLLLDAIEQEQPDMLMFKYITDHGTMKLRKKCSLPQLMTAKEAMIYKIKTANPIWHYLWNKCYKMSVIKSCDIRFEEGCRSAEDVEFNRKFLKVAKKIMYLDNYFYSYNCTNASSVTRQTSMPTEEWLVQRWTHETNRYKTLLDDCVELDCKHTCQPYLAKDLANTAVRLTAMSRKIGGGYLPDVIKKDALYPILHEYIWKARMDYHISKLKTTVKQIIKRLL